MRNLPAVESHSDTETDTDTRGAAVDAETRAVPTEVRETRTISSTHVQCSPPVGLAERLRSARARAEQIVRAHPPYHGRIGTTCQPCLVDYPCDAVRAAEDILAISSQLHPGRLVSSQGMLDLLVELVAIGAADPQRDPDSQSDRTRRRREDEQAPDELPEQDEPIADRKREQTDPPVPGRTPVQIS